MRAEWEEVRRAPRKEPGIMDDVRGLLLAMVLAAPACAWTNNNAPVDQGHSRFSDSHRTMAPDGGPAWAVACARTIGECYDECARVCPYGYNIIDKSNEGYVSQSGAVGGNGWAVGQGSSAIDRISMLISCKSGWAPQTNPGTSLPVPAVPAPNY
jgi:hypothetical protein